VTDNKSKTFRVRFEKTAAMKYISHLDLNRLFARSLARAQIEAEYSEGFNPHPKIAFASALSLGIESLCEFADVKIKGNRTGAEILMQTKGAFPPGINILEVYEPATDFKNIDRARFHIFVKPEGFGPGELEELFSGAVVVEKRPGVVVDLKDYICEIAISQSQKDGSLLIDSVLKTNREMFLNPENIIKAVNSKFSAGDYFIRKIETYNHHNAVFR